MLLTTILVLTISNYAISSEECGQASINESRFPWNAGIYVKTTDNELGLICFGSILSNNTIITAAHCLYDSLSDNKRTDPLYVVAGAEYSINLNINNNFITEKFNADNIIIHPSFHGFLKSYNSDIALIKLTKGLKFNKKIKSVCIDWSRDISLINTIGIQAIWNGKSLIRENRKYLGNDHCYYSISDNLKDLITNDKFCTSSDEKSETSIRNSGAGFISFNSKKNSWYLKGVLSSFDQTTEIMILTSIDQYIDWIFQNLH